MTGIWVDEPSFSQVIADKLGISMEDVDIQHGDTGKVLFGMGTYGSRSLAVGGTAIVKAADKIIAKGKKIAAHLLEASDADVEFANGQVTKFPPGALIQLEEKGGAEARQADCERMGVSWNCG